MLTLDQAKNLRRGDWLVDTNNKRWKVNGAVQTWKRDSLRVKVPIKHGLYQYGYLTDLNLEYFRMES